MARVRDAMAALLALTLAAGLLVPIYTDEVAWRIQLSRWALDGWVDRSVGETCGPNTHARPPVVMWPVRLFSSGVTWLVRDPLLVRLAGVGCAVAAVLLVRALVRRLAPEPGRAARMELAAYALLGIGTLPFLLVWSRPEQPMLLALLTALLLALAPAAERPRGFHLRLAGVLLAALISLSYHLKTTFYLPAYAAALLAAPAPPRLAGGRIARGVALAALALAGLIAARYWSERFACPADAVIAAKLAHENVTALLLGGGWRGAAAALPHLIDDMAPTLYVRAATPNAPIMSDWLPPPPVPRALASAWVASCDVAWAAAGLLGLAAAARATRDPARDGRRLALGAALVCCATGWAALQLNKNAYEASLYLPVMTLAGLLFWSAGRREPPLATPLIGLIALVSALSQGLLLATYAPRLWPTTRGGYIAGQPYSVGAFRFDRGAIVAAGAKCGLAPRPGLRRVLIDDLTYFAYARTDTPLYRLGFLEGWNGSIRDPAAFLHAHGSPGAVLACSELPPAMRARAVASGPLCCVSTR